MKKVVAVIFVILGFTGCTAANVNKSTAVKIPDKVSSKKHIDGNGELSSIINYSYEEKSGFGIFNDGFTRKGIIKNRDGKILGTESVKYNKNGELTEIESYDSSGSKIKSRKYQPVKNGYEELFENGRSHIKNVFLKDSNGGLLIKTSYNESGKMEWQDEYRYNISGEILSESYKDSNGIEKWGYKYSYEYDKAGGKTKQTVESIDGKAYYEVYINEYNDNNKPAKITTKYQNGDIKCIEEYIYNNNNLIEKRRLNDFDEETEKIRYDINGRITEEKRRGTDENISLWKEYHYDNSGKLTEEKNFDYSGEVASVIIYTF